MLESDGAALKCDRATLNRLELPEDGAQGGMVRSLISIAEALDQVLACVPAPEVEEIQLLEAFDRVLADDLTSPEDVPSFDNSAMDGFALRGADLEAGRRQFAVTLEIPAGRWVDVPVSAGEAAKIMTGAPLPPGADTVVPVEQTASAGAELTVLDASPTGANVRRAGEDVGRGSPLLSRGTRLGPAEIGLLASVGSATVPVGRRPRVSVLATGSELIVPGKPVGPGQIRNSNSFTMHGQVLAAGGLPTPLGIARDDLDETRRLMAAALIADVAVTSGGVSVGEFDFVKQVKDELGVGRRFWGVRSKPGKPVTFGLRGRTLVFGLPGNPVASMVSFELFVRPALLAMQGAARIFRPFVWAAAEEPVRPGKDRTEARRCRIVYGKGGGWRFTTTGPQGSGILRSMALADGLAFVPAGHSGGQTGERFLVMLLEGTSDQRPPYPD
jgi:molybdopterin molybdotransferase